MNEISKSNKRHILQNLQQISREEVALHIKITKFAKKNPTIIQYLPYIIRWELGL